MPTARSGTGAEALDGKIHVLAAKAGSRSSAACSARTRRTTKDNSWAKLPRMLTPRHGFATAQIGRRIYAVSGVNNAGGAGTLSW